MIEKLEPLQGLDHSWLKKINELVDTVNTIQKEREAERFEIQEWIGILEAVRKSVNVHEKQIDKLQMKSAQEDFDNAILGALKNKKVDVVVEPEAANTFAEHKKWIRKLCWFWNDGCSDYIGILYKIHDLEESPFENDLMEKYQHCRPVKPDDPIIYKGE